MEAHCELRSHQTKETSAQSTQKCEKYCGLLATRLFSQSSPFKCKGWCFGETWFFFFHVKDNLPDHPQSVDNSTMDLLLRCFFRLSFTRQPLVSSWAHFATCICYSASRQQMKLSTMIPRQAGISMGASWINLEARGCETHYFCKNKQRII